LQIELHHGVGALDDLESEWIALSARAREHFCSQTYYWACHAWELAAKRGNCRLAILTGRDHGRLVLIWPLLIRRRLVWREAEWLGSGYEYRDVLVDHNPDAVRWVGQAWHFAKTELGVDLLSCPSIRPDAAIFPMLKQEPVVTRWRTPVLFVAARRWPDWAHYRQGQRAKFRRGQQRRRRRLAERGQVVFEVAADGDQVDELMVWLFRQKREWARRTGLRLPWLRSDAYEMFLNAAARDAHGAGELMLCALKLDDQVLAAVLAFVCGSRMELYLMAYDRAWRSYGPGLLIFEDAVKWAFERRLAVVDFRSGVEAFKYDFAKDETERCDYVVPCSRWGASYVSWRLSAVRGIISRCYRALPMGVQQTLKPH